MRSTITVILILAASAGMIFLGIAFSFIHPIEINVFHLISCFLIPGLVLVAFIPEVMRGKSPTFTSDAISHSINDIEIKYIPWNNDLVKNNSKPMEMAFIPLGGINYWSFNPPSGSDKPLVIQPSMDLSKKGNGYISYTNLKPTLLSELPPDLRHFAVRTYGKRILKCPRIYFGLTSNLDGSANAHNERIWFERAKQNEQVTQMENLLKWSTKELERKNRAKEKTFVIDKIGSGYEED